MPIPVNIIGAFADSGGTVTTLEWTPDPDEVEQALVEAASDLEDMSGPLRASARITMLDIQNNFDTESDPDGKKWVPLDKDYLEYKTSLGGDTRILHLWGPLERAATMFSNFVIEGEEGLLLYNTENLDALAPYWDSHQSGTETEAGKALGFSRVTAELLGEDVSDMPGPGTGAAIPARPFIGVSGEAEEMIFEVFDLWVSDQIQIKISSAGIVQNAPGGRFGTPFNFSGA